MLEKILIGILLCIIGLMAVSFEVLWVKLKRERKLTASLKLAVEHWEREAHR